MLRKERNATNEVLGAELEDFAHRDSHKSVGSESRMQQVKVNGVSQLVHYD
jgi:hypothetical protein